MFLLFLICCRTDLNILTLAPLVSVMSIKLSSVFDHTMLFAMMGTDFNVFDPNDEKKCCSSIFVGFVFRNNILNTPQGFPLINVSFLIGQFSLESRNMQIRNFREIPTII